MNFDCFLGFYLKEVKNEIEKEYNIKSIKMLLPPSKKFDCLENTRIVKIKLVNNNDLEVLVCKTL